MRIFTSCGSEGSGDDSPRRAQRGRGGPQAGFLFARFQPSTGLGFAPGPRDKADCYRLRGRVPLAVSSVSTTGLAAGKDRHFDLHTPPALRGDRKSRAPLH